jgi:hypothetical protein
LTGRGVGVPDLVEHRLVGEDAMLETYAEAAASRRALWRKVNGEMHSAMPLFGWICCQIP